MTQERRQYMREYRKAHTEQIKQIHKTYYKKNTKKCIFRSRQYQINHVEGLKRWYSKYSKSKRKNDIQYKLRANLQPMWGKDNISKHDFHVLDFREGVF